MGSRHLSRDSLTDIAKIVRDMESALVVPERLARRFRAAARERAPGHPVVVRVPPSAEYPPRAPAAHRGKRARARPTFFDALPKDVCVRIAEFVTGGQPSHNALHFAEACRASRDAVVSALDNTYVCINNWYYGRDIALRWAALFGDDLHKLIILHSRICDVDAYDRLAESAGLRSLEAKDSTYQLLCDKAYSTMEHLSISLTGVLPQPLFSDTSNPCVKDLTLTCMRPRTGDDPEKCCPLARFSAHGAAANIIRAFPNLEAIEVSSICNCEKYFLLELAMTAPNLKEIRLNHVVIPNGLIPILHTMQSVKIAHGSQGLTLARAIGFVLTGLQTGQIVDEEDLQLLDVWKNLECIAIALCTGAEAAFLERVPLFSETLEVLKLSRSYIDDEHLQVRADTGLPCREPQDGVWLKIVQGLPHITTLGVMDVKMPLDELDAIMKHMGARLEVLEMSLHNQKEHPLVRLDKVVDTLVQHCPNLKLLALDYQRFDDGDFDRGSPQPKQWTLEMAKKLRRRLVELKRLSPIFDDLEAMVFVQNLITPWKT